ncbi:hypothetical protein HCN44_006630 [Aphidius gifuensis]|uniref:Uncharacterized protein n=1 Tax=Aphidius gifuensis TaxID=684658 RepID=A0A835CVM6_APHGI|nr:hypothetical protein HCN44_006630 [Aphidius gifuensis]
MMGKSRNEKLSHDLALNILPSKKNIEGFWAKLRYRKKNFVKKIGYSNKIKLINNVDERMSLKSSRINSSRVKNCQGKQKNKNTSDSSDCEQDVDYYDYNAMLSQPDIQNFINEKEKTINNDNKINKIDDITNTDKLIMKNNNNNEILQIEKKKKKPISRIPRAKKPGFVVNGRASRLYSMTKFNNKNIKNIKRPIVKTQTVATNINSKQVDVNLQTNHDNNYIKNHDVKLNLPTEQSATSLSVIPGSKVSSCSHLWENKNSPLQKSSRKMTKCPSWPTNNNSSLRTFKSRRMFTSSTDDELSASSDNFDSSYNNKAKEMKINNSSTSKIKPKEPHLIHSFFTTLFDIVFWPLLFTRNNRK